MAQEVRIRLLGTPSAFVGVQPVTGFVSTKSQALLYYLAATEGSHRRDALAALLWSEVPDATARRNLRDILSNLRRLVGPFLTITRHEAGLRPDAPTTCDSQTFLRAVSAARGTGSLTGPAPPGHLEPLAAAVNLYKGDFLAGFYVSDAPLFEEWMLEQREHLRQALAHALEMLVAGCTARREYKTAIGYAMRWSALDPLQELPHRALMRLYAEDGDRPAAMKQYDELKRLLEETLGVQPASETKALFEQIRQGDVAESVPERGTLNVRGYELRELISERRHTALYRAYQPLTGRNVAVKVIQPPLANRPDFIRRFEREAKLVAALEHPYIVPLYDYWREPDCAFLVMRWLAGGSLQDDLQRGPWGLAEAGQLLDQIGAALAAAHSRRVVHRDIKPANILLDESRRAFLADFGIAGQLGSGSAPEHAAGHASSPEYAPPEQRLGQPPNPSTDIYSLGMVLFEMLVGADRFRAHWVDARQSKALPEVVPFSITDDASLPPPVVAVIRRATARDPARRYPDALSLVAAFHQAVSGAAYAPPATVPDPEVANPYKGLRAFQESDAPNFFGREALIQLLVSRLCDSRFLAVVGPSGSGKSSLVKAGLLPALRHGAVPGSEAWFVAEMTPGEQPLEELARALTPIAVDSPPGLPAALREDPQALRRTLQRILPGGSENRLLLVIDQFEELFTLLADESQRLHFIDCLLAALDDPRGPLRIVITLRADFYDRPLQIQPLAALFKRSTEVVLPLDRQELTRAIRQPAQGVGVGIEEGLVTAMVADVAGQPGALPLLQYTLTELFDARQHNLMTLAAYESLGGVAGALARRADEIYAGFDEAEQAACRQLMLRLVTLGEGVEDTRRRVLFSELISVLGPEESRGHQPQSAATPRAPAAYPQPPTARLHSNVSTVLDALGRARLLTFDRDPSTREPTVEVAHEALLREWARLRRWLDESRADVRLQRLLAAETSAWQKKARDPGYLLRGSRLDQYKDWTAQATVRLTREERDFLAASFAARETRLAAEEARQRRELQTAQQLAQSERDRAEEQARAADRLRRRALVLVASLAIAAILAIAALFFAQQSNQNAAAAAENAGIAGTRGAEAAAEADFRATAQVDAERQAALATSRELAATALNQLNVDAERSILLALHALSQARTLEAENALHQAVQTSRVVHTLRGHAGPLFFLDYSPDGTRVATTGGDGVAKVWDAATGEELLTLQGHDAEVFGISFSPDGKRLATASHDGTVRVWDVQSGEHLLTLGDGAAELMIVRFSPDGRQIAANENFGGHIKIWDATTGEPLASFLAHEAPMWFVTFDPAGERLATAGVDRTARVWDAASKELLLTLGGHADLVSRVNFSPDGDRLVTSSLKARIWDASTGTELLTLDGHHGLVLWVEFSPDGRRIATSGFDGLVKLWDASTGDELFTLSGHTGVVVSLAFSPDGTRLATSSYDGSARIWDLTPERELLTLAGHEAFVHSIAFNPAGTRLISAGDDGTAQVWDIGDPTAATFGQQLLSVGKADPANGTRAVAYSPDGTRFVATNAAGIATVHDAQTGATLLTLRGHAPGLTGETVYNGITGAAYSPDGRLIATGGDDLTAKIWDAQSGDLLFTLEGHASATAVVPPHEGVIDLTFDPTGTFLATAGADGIVKIWSTEDGRQLLDLPAHSDSGVVALAFNPDGTRLVTGAFDGSVKLWQVSPTPPTVGKGLALEELFALIGHTSAAYGVVFTPDGSRLATAGEDGTAKLWNATTGQELLTLTVQPQGLLDVAITPDGKYLATAGRDGTVRLFVLSTDQLIALAQSRVTRTLTAAECQRYLHLQACPPP